MNPISKPKLLLDVLSGVDLWWRAMSFKVIFDLFISVASVTQKLKKKKTAKKHENINSDSSILAVLLSTDHW